MSSDLVLVTGASGYLASHIIKQLLELGYRVRGTVRSLNNERKVAPLRNLAENPKYPLELVEAALLNAESWQNVVKGSTIVIHTASPFPNSIPNDENELIRPAVNGTLNVFQACVTPGSTVKRVVLTSSTAAVYCGKLVNGETYTEDDWTDVNATTPYEKSKTLAEKAAWDFVKQRKEKNEPCFELAVINPGLILGPSLHKSEYTSMELVKKLLERQIPLLPRLDFPTCDVRDVALAHIRAMTDPDAVDHRHIIASTTESNSIQDYAIILDAEFRSQGYNVPLTLSPNFLIKVASIFDKSVRLVTSFLGYKFKFDTTRMKTVLKIEPIELKKTVIDMAYDMIEKGYIKKN